ncbi:DAK2 domain-containing protein [Virgisporangium aliadipatigenens]|uniref:DAK2 domain-containing protein n=1 Tax=Virgisporangium aliadipatigenens TaxID=741659 RepID=UPI0019454B3C|nr:DAK2 domain-containing protein [Virgisporangium aliadipatigenens]
MLDSFDAAAVRRWCAHGLDALRRHQREIDDLNVYPVPDGDTGTNLVLTFDAALKALSGQDGDRPLTLAARGALLGARGNSGVIVAQMLRALADTLPAEAGGRAFAGALGHAADAAYRAVAAPVEGTVLSVARAAADAAERAGSDDLATVVRHAADGAARALERTPEQLPALARAGVVDAGGRGLCVLLDALAEIVTGEAPERTPHAGAQKQPQQAQRPAREHGIGEAFAYEVQYLLEAPDEAVAPLKEKLARLGDSLAVVGTGDGTWNVHVHVDAIGPAIEAGVEAGRPYRIDVTRFEDQLEQRERATVVLCAGDGLARIFAAEGAHVVTTPSPAEILGAIRASGAGQIVVLPNDKDAAAVAATAAAEARAAGKQVAVVPTRSPVQALAALAVRDPQRRFEDDVIEMAEASGACRYAEVTVAARAALTVAGPCQPGDVIALIDGEVALIGADTASVCRDLIDRLLGAGGELVTLLTGEGATEALVEELGAHVAGRWPFVEVNVYEGGQPHYPLLVGVE